METIDELIIIEFNNAGYSQIDKIEKAVIFSNNDYSDFWLIVDDFDVDIEYQKKLFETYKNSLCNYSAAAKNTSILILKEVGHIDETNQNWAVDVENDKYFFKKYVLLYTEDALFRLKNEILVRNEKSIASYLTDTNIFDKLKEDTVDGPYCLLYGIAHKLPFILVRMNKTDLELAYPTIWSTPEISRINDWVDSIPEVDIDRYLDNLLSKISYE